MTVALLILAVILAAIEAVRSRSFGWAAVALIALAMCWQPLTHLAAS